MIFAPEGQHDSSQVRSALESLIDLEASLNGANRTQAGSLCYINAVAPELQVHGGSSQDGSERSLGSPEDQCSIGFQPVFFRTERCFRTRRRIREINSSASKQRHPKPRR
jgi:hypothetical protein